MRSEVALLLHAWSTATVQTTNSTIPHAPRVFRNMSPSAFLIWKNILIVPIALILSQWWSSPVCRPRIPLDRSRRITLPVLCRQPDRSLHTAALEAWGTSENSDHWPSVGTDKK